MLDNLTGLRFYAAFWVFLFHYFVFYTEFTEVLFFQIGYLGVDVFFILSGFILTYVYYKHFFEKKFSSKDYYDFVIKRFAKIYPLHIFMTIVLIIFFYFCKYLLSKNSINIYPETIAPHFLLIHSWGTITNFCWNSHSWSVSAEWFAYLFLFAPAAFLYNRLRIFSYVLFGIVVLGFVWYWVRISDFSLGMFVMNAFPRIIPEFILGVLIGLFRKHIYLNNLIASLLFIVGVLFTTFIFVGDFYSQQLCVFSFSAIILALSYKTVFDFMFSSKLFIYLGNTSYALYMTQLFSLIIAGQTFGYVFSDDMNLVLREVCKFIIAFSINLVLASLAYHYLEEPIRIKLINRLIK